MSTALEQFSKYSEIWTKDRDAELDEFMKLSPRLSEFESQILYYIEREKDIMAEDTHYDVGPIALFTGRGNDNMVWVCVRYIIMAEDTHYDVGPIALFTGRGNDNMVWVCVRYIIMAEDTHYDVGPIALFTGRGNDNMVWVCVRYIIMAEDTHYDMGPIALFTGMLKYGE